MRLYSRGPKDPASCARRAEKWAGLWDAGCPLSGMLVSDRETGRRLGFIRLAATSAPGVAELSYLFAPHAWGQGYATEAASAVLRGYVLAVTQAQCRIGGQALSLVYSTVRAENAASLRVLHKCGMQHAHTFSRRGAQVHVYALAAASRPPDLAPSGRGA